MKHSNPFVAGPMLQNPELFVGREEQLRAIISRMRGSQPTSLNIVGEHQIGKSSLLYHFFLTWQQRVSHPKSYVVIYLSLKNANCQKEKNFYQAIANGLLNSPSVVIQPKLVELLQTNPLNRLSFSQAIAEFKKQDLLPVLCLDDFESIFAHKNERHKEFDNGFYDNLRALMNDSALMLVIASCKELDVYGQEYRLISDFFNVGHVLKLGEFTKDEAIQLTRLSVNSIEETPALTEEEQKLAQKWGQFHPYLLQLASYYLLEAREIGKDCKWAKKQFDLQFDKYKSKTKVGNNHNIWWLIIVLIIFLFGIIIGMITMPTFIFNLFDAIGIDLNPIGNISITLIILNALGAIGQALDTVENLAHITIALFILTLFMLSLTPLLPWEDVKNYLLNWMKK